MVGGISIGVGLEELGWSLSLLSLTISMVIGRARDRQLGKIYENKNSVNNVKLIIFKTSDRR